MKKEKYSKPTVTKKRLILKFAIGKRDRYMTDANTYSVRYLALTWV